MHFLAEAQYPEAEMAEFTDNARKCIDEGNDPSFDFVFFLNLILIYDLLTLRI